MTNRKNVDVVWKLQCNEKNERYKHVIHRMAKSVVAVAASSKAEVFRDDLCRAVKCLYKPEMLGKRLEDYITTAAVKQLKLAISPVAPSLSTPTIANHPPTVSSQFCRGCEQLPDPLMRRHAWPPPLKRSSSSPPLNEQRYACSSLPILSTGATMDSLAHPHRVSGSAPSPDLATDAGLESFPRYGISPDGQSVVASSAACARSASMVFASASSPRRTSPSAQQLSASVDLVESCSNTCATAVPSAPAQPQAESQSTTTRDIETPCRRTYSHHLLQQAASVLSQLQSFESPASDSVRNLPPCSPLMLPDTQETSNYVETSPASGSVENLKMAACEDFSQMFSPESIATPEGLLNRISRQYTENGDAGWKDVTSTDEEFEERMSKKQQPWVVKDPDFVASDEREGRLKLTSGVWTSAAHQNRSTTANANLESNRTAPSTPANSVPLRNWREKAYNAASTDKLVDNNPDRAAESCSNRQSRAGSSDLPTTNPTRSAVSPSKLDFTGLTRNASPTINVSADTNAGASRNTAESVMSPILKPQNVGYVASAILQKPRNQVIVNFPSPDRFNPKNTEQVSPARVEFSPVARRSDSLKRELKVFLPEPKKRRFGVELSSAVPEGVDVYEFHVDNCSQETVTDVDLLFSP